MNIFNLSKNYGEKTHIPITMYISKKMKINLKDIIELIDDKDIKEKLMSLF